MLKKVLQPSTYAEGAAQCEGADDPLAERRAVMLVKNGSALSIERTLLGDPSVPSGRRLEILADADKLGGVQRALWETQRCLLPCTAMQYQDPGSFRQVHWHVPGRPLVYVAGIRLVTRVSERMQPWCLLISRQHLGTGPQLPLYLTDMTPREWLELDGISAWDHVRLSWQIADRKAVLP